jgi:1-acyl-sn-glycerol-3-phosphate acyltransferase
MTSDSTYDQIRPYVGKEIPQAAERLSLSEDFLTLFSSMLKVEKNRLTESLHGISSRDEFQDRFFIPVVKRLISGTTDGVTVSGVENLEKDSSYLFISNHRDIILDSALLNSLLKDHGLHYCQAAIGSNLLINSWITDLVKLDSCFIIERGLPVKEMIVSAGLRSHYLREVIKEQRDSVWIAQKEGRSKNGDDRTQPSLLKMFRMSGTKDFVENFKQLHIVPVSISYEWEPCDDLKTDELYQKNTDDYVRTPAADMKSMYQGMSDYKGRVNFFIGKPVDRQLDEINKLPNHGDRIAALADYIDTCIHQGFKLWPNNYIAYDLLHGTARFLSFYNNEEKDHFIKTMQQKLDRLSGNRSVLNNIYLEIYATPVKNKLEP